MPNGHVNGNGSGTAVDGRGRSMKRMLRSSLSTVEQHASSFFSAAGSGSGSGTRTPQDEDVVVADVGGGTEGEWGEGDEGDDGDGDRDGVKT
ncbi:hypothetical protein EVG20_g535 [Dentipellis fragilis]|uniref:Uncharacterized protein n=1 Tax=Dentipellis fragilis TaxID=205917 RepID=A0A4Y9ZEM8_9AGAM|nr:hypothetical protein EVG20_g535 [Dentipellis fragilis]